MIGAAFPGDGTVRSNLDELELHVYACRKGSVQEPVRLARIEHGADGGIECCAPVAKLYGTARKKNVVARVCGRGVVDRESYRNEFRSEYRELNRIRRRPGTVLEFHLIDAIA